MADTTVTPADMAAHGHDDHGHDDHAAHDHPSYGRYVQIALILGVFTLIEVGTFWPFGEWFEARPNIMILMLSVLMIIKFVIVVSEFMHLRFDSKIYRWMFAAGLILAIGVYFIVFFAENLF